MTSTGLIRHTLMTLMTVAVFTGCQDSSTGVADAVPGLGEIDEALGPGVHPVLIVDANTGGSIEAVRVQLHLRAVGTEGDIQSYQGWMRFDPERTKVVGGSAPEGLLGAWNEVSPGVVRFAGVVLEGLTNGPVMRFDISTVEELKNGDIMVELDELAGRLEEETYRILEGHASYPVAAPVYYGVLEDPGDA